MSKVTDPEATCADSDSAASNGHGLSTDEPAEWISGAHWADELGVDPDCGIGDVLGADAWKAVRRFSRRFDVGLSHFGADGMAFADFDALPREIWHTASPKVEITRAQATAFAEDMLKEDPHDIGERLNRDRAQRFRERNRVERALGAKGIPAATEYTFDAVEAAAGPEIAVRARELVDRANRRAWSTPKPHSHPEHEHLLCAAELHDKLGVSVTTIATMTAATEQERDSALGELNVARFRHRDDAIQRARAGDTDPDDGSPLYTDIGQLLDNGLPSPPTPDILRRTDGIGLFYRNEINLLYGDPEDGKTMIALAACAQVLRDGGIALFVDLDDNGVESIVARVRMLGAPDSALREGRFRYCSPAGRDRLERAVSDCTVDSRVPDIAVIDCVGELVPLFDGSNNDSDDFTRIIRVTAGPLARAGACVILIDHMAKNTDSRNYGAGGTIAKRRRVGGTQLRVNVEVPLRKGEGGTLRLSIRKDRHSGLRQHCYSSTDEKLQQAGRFIIDPGDTAWCVAVDPMVLSSRDGARATADKHRPYIDAAKQLDSGWTIKALATKVHGEQVNAAQLKATGRVVTEIVAPGGCIEKLTESARFKPATYRFVLGTDGLDGE